VFVTIQAVSDYYDRHYRRRIGEVQIPANVRPGDLGLIRLLLKCDASPKRILDVGCGMGGTLQYLAAIPGVEKLYGVDPSPFALEEAKRRFPDAAVFVGYGEDMSMIADGSCDAVVGAAVMEHVYDTHRVLNAINRVLQPGGVAAFYTTDFNLPKKVLAALFAFEKCFDVCSGHIRFFTKKSLTAVMVEHGFERIGYEWQDSYWGVMPKGQNAIFRKIAEKHILREMT
jgi:ubiquinone/menaquinone biosynthesis C-methylase UbiE